MSEQTDDLLAANPFPGLRSFEPNEADRFFGRQQQIASLVERLAQVPLIAVYGASGCGKSSLVKAGLLNELRRQHDEEGATDWRPVVMRPGNRPIAHLAEALAAALPRTPSEAGDAVDDGLDPLARRTASLNGQLHMGGGSLVEVVRLARLPAGTRVLLVVDQFEELFRFKRIADTEEASAFVRMLLQAVARPDAQVSVVLTLRSDTLGGCSDFPGLPEAVSAGGYLVPRLTRSQRKEAIVKPVELRGAQIAPRLVQRLLADVSDDFDDLPIMQHVLSRCWQWWAGHEGSGRPIDLDDYTAVGGANGALSKHADEACDSLGALGADGGAVERVFRALTERVSEGTELRRPMPLGWLRAICSDGSAQGMADVDQVVERYRRADTAFLMPGPLVPLADEVVIDISHESLIRQWERLRRWAVAESEAKGELVRLLEDAQALERGKGELWTGLDLVRAREWQKDNRPNAAWVRLCTGGTEAEAEARFQLVQRFLDQSTEVQARQRRKTQMLRWGVRGLAAGVTVVSVAAAVVGFGLQRKAVSRDWSAQAQQQIVQDPARSALLALEAVDKDASNPRGEFALRRAMAALEVARTESILEFPEPVVEARFSVDGAQMVVSSGKRLWMLQRADLDRPQSGPSNVARKVDALPGVVAMDVPNEIYGAWVTNEGQVVAIGEGRVHLLQMRQARAAELPCATKDAWAAKIAFHETPGTAPTARVAVACSDRSLIVWDLAAGKDPVRHQLSSGPGYDVTALGFSADGTYLAAGEGILADPEMPSKEGGAWVRIWKRGTDDRPWVSLPPGRPSAERAAITDVSFARTDAALIAVSDDDGGVRALRVDLQGDRPRDARPAAAAVGTLRHGRPVSRARFFDRAGDRNLLFSIADFRVSIWRDAQTKLELRHDGLVAAANTSADGELLVAWSDDGTASVWSTRTAVPLVKLRGHSDAIMRALFDPRDKTRVVTAGLDGTLRVWRLQTPTLLTTGNRPRNSVALNEVLDARRTMAVVCGEPDADGAPCLFRPLSGETAPAPAPVIHFAGAGPRDAKAVAMPAHLNVQYMALGANFSRDGSLALVHEVDYSVYGAKQPHIYDADGAIEQTPEWMRTSIHAVFHAHADEVAVLDVEGEVRLWPLKALKASDGSTPAQPLMAVPPPKAPVRRSLVALSPDSRWIATVDDNVVLLWNRRQQQQAPLRLAGHKGAVVQLNFSTDGSRLVTASADRTARVWPLKGLDDKAQPPKSVELLGGHSSALTSAAFSPDGQRVVTSGADGSLRVWNAVDGREMAALFQRHRGKINQAIFDPTGTRIISVGDDGNALVSPCQACALPLKELTERARREVVSTENDQNWLRAIVAHPYLPRWMTGDR